MSTFWKSVDKGLSVFFDGLFASFTPNKWPLVLRRTFLLTIPMSGPVWLLWCFVLAVVILILAGIIVVLFKLAKWLAFLWTDDPKVRQWFEEMERG
jgi:hypothetical protein